MGYAMLKLSVSFFVLFSCLSFQLIYSQPLSIQLNGGLLSPRSASNGFSGSVQFNLPLNTSTSLYLSTGYSSWDKYNMVFRFEGSSQEYSKSEYPTFLEDEHLMIPVFIGIKKDVHTTELFTTFLNFEVGYSHLKFNRYYKWNEIRKWNEYDNDWGAITDYVPDEASKREIKLNLYGFGFGAGLVHSINSNLNILLSFKINTNLSSDFEGIFSTKGTYTSLLAGLNFSI